MKHRATVRWLSAAILLTLSLIATAQTGALWISSNRPTPQAVALLSILDHADDYGLSPAAYRLDLSPGAVQAVLTGRADAESLRRFDASLTDATSRFVEHVARGRVTAQMAGFDLPSQRSGFDAARSTVELAKATDVRAAIATIEPRPAPYRMLKDALGQYRELARTPALTRLPPLTKRSLAVGDEYAGAPQLRALLLALGDLDSANASVHESETIIDADLVQALRRFQNRHGLAADGVMGAGTFQALTTPLSYRVRQIELAMERWRWLNAVDRPNIVVDISHYTLYALPRPQRSEEQMLEMPVIVGRKNDRTPIFMARIQEVIFHPYWDVPVSILRRELLPRIRKDLGYLDRHHFEMVRGEGDDAAVVPPSADALDALIAGRLRLRQRPGADNALGPVKFVLPNPYSIRLHGTPEQKLFAQPQRAFSHGCIRVSQPAELAEYVLANAEGVWDSATVATALCSNTTQRIKLKSPVSVIVFYATASVTRSRGVLFSPDVYGHDARLEQLLAASAHHRPRSPSL